MSRTAVIAGVGPGLGATVAHKLATEQCSVGLLARSEDYLIELTDELQTTEGDAIAVPTDLSDPDQIERGFERVREEFGRIDILIYNPSVSARGQLFDLSPEDFERVWEVMIMGAFLCSREVAADMVDSDGGTIIFTGTSLAKRALGNLLAWDSLGPALRGMAQSIARAFNPEGIHVAYTIIDGAIAASGGESEVNRPEDRMIDPVEVADAYWYLIQQSPSAWTFELDLRTSADEMRY
ncbi:MAG TPA: SDR family NAD(P)-dependent oxidoreductase [Halococcus sp.]|nr:SDR family NAD(P)-dependent oxidoreductase [Halococcus sp.]